MSVTATAKYQSLWSFKSYNNPTCRDELKDMFTRMWKKHGPAKDWPLDARIFDSEGPKFRKHISKRGWTKDHIPIWCQDAIEARAKENGGIKKSPPGGFYRLTTSRQEPHEAMENALMCLSFYFTGLRWIDSGHREPAWCTKMESLTEVFRFDEIWEETKCQKREMDRIFEIQMVAPDFPPQALVRFVLSEFQERQLSL